jgi:hypothetical protein
MRYTDEQQQAALDCLASNDGDFAQTSARTNIPERTLRKWAQGQQASLSRAAALAALRDQLAAYAESIRQHSQPDDVVGHAGTVLMLSMIDDAIRISGSMWETIDAAPLNQRASALNQLIDKILRLSKELPHTGEQVIRIEFIDPDGTAHETPYWARSHSDERSAL